MLTESHSEKRGSDWIDVIWASWENAFVNAEVYHALTRWSELEEVMGDSTKAHSYRSFAAGLKKSFNKTTEEGGFWDAGNRWYVHWRERDGSVYGNNLVTPVNFMAIGYGLCDNALARVSILDAIENQMQKEQLFFWPICMFPYEPGAGHDLNYPFPSYENGDLFLSWGELGIRSYAADFPEIALRYVKNVIDRYNKDGLAYQRCLRTTQQGSGDDILAGNASAITGLFRDIYGIQPRYNRLYLNPHLVNELYGTHIRYRFQSREYQIDLGGIQNAIAVAGAKVSSPDDFAMKADGARILWYSRNSGKTSMSLTKSGSSLLELTIRQWSGRRCWTEKNASRTAAVSHRILDLVPNQEYPIYCDGHLVGIEHSDKEGTIRFDYASYKGGEQLFEVLLKRE